MPKISWNKLTKDLLALIVLIGILAPLYLIALDQIPFPISGDEITLMRVEKNILHTQNVNPFGLSDYFNIPTLIFWIFGNLAQLLGGINLQNIRFIHASFGLLGIATSYFLFRALNKKVIFAFLASFIIGVNHSMMVISRMALRDNTPILIETASLGLLFLSLRKSSFLLAILGGATAGLGFYIYFPARITIFIWIGFLLCLWFFKKFNRRFILKHFLGFLIGSLFISLPVNIASVQNIDGAMHHPRQQLLIFKEGRELQQRWVSAPSEWEGIKTNIINGLTVFNNNIVDHGWIYFNPKHGFVDPVTGVFVWIGLILILTKAARKTFTSADGLILVGFFLQIFTFSFIVNKAPDYTRLLIILPFSSYLVLEVIDKLKPKTLVLAMVLIILLLNLSIFNDFVQKGFREGEDIGSTARFVMSKNNLPGYTFYIVYNLEYPYYSFPGSWHDFFIGEGQKAQTLSPDNFMYNLNRPFIVLMSNYLWVKSQTQFATKYPNFQIDNIKPDGSLVAIEVN